MAIRIVCSWCGSIDVSRDARASWDEDPQVRVLGVVLDDGYCHRCERERGLEERTLLRVVAGGAVLTDPIL